LILPVFLSHLFLITPIPQPTTVAGEAWGVSGTDGDHRGDTWGDRDQDPEIWDQLSCTTHQESPMIGVINGATIMAPMIAGAITGATTITANDGRTVGTWPGPQS
jgi:hypothetical protein